MTATDLEERALAGLASLDEIASETMRPKGEIGTPVKTEATEKLRRRARGGRRKKKKAATSVPVPKWTSPRRRPVSSCLDAVIVHQRP